MAWALVWLAGISGLVAFSVDRYVPMIESELTEDVRSAVSLSDESPIEVAVEGHRAVLSGPVYDDQQRRALVDSAMATPGIFAVSDKLVLKSDTPAALADDNQAPLQSGNVEQERSELELSASDPASPDPSSSTLPTPEASTAEAIAEADTDTASEADALVVAELPAGNPANDSSAAGQTSSEAAVPADVAGNEAVEASNNDRGDEPPQMDLQVRDGVMTISGRIASGDAMDQLMQIARDSLDVSAISDSVVMSDNTSAAQWLEPVSSLLPALALLEQPGLQISDDQVVLSGTAPDDDTYDAVVNEALQALTGFMLVEDIEIAEPEADVEALAETETETEGEGESQMDVLSQAELDAQLALESEAMPELDASGTDAPSEVVTGTDADQDVGQNAGSATDPETSDPTRTLARNETEPVDPGNDTLDDRRAAFAQAMDNLESSRVLFRSGQDVLTNRSTQVLNDIAQILRAYPDVPLGIDGHTDSAGDRTDNLRLSQRRANAVREYLVAQGVSVFRLSARGFGEELPLVRNDSRRGRAANRRIEFNY